MEHLTTDKIIEYIKTAYFKTVEKVNNQHPLYFGYECGKVNILVSFTSSVPNKSNIYSCEKYQQYLVKDLAQVVEILTKLEEYREEAIVELKLAYLKEVLDINNQAYLTVTSFKPIGFN